MISQQIASAIRELSIEKLPGEIRHAAKRSLLDTLGAALAGFPTEEVRFLLESTAMWGRGGPGIVWGSAIKITAPHAALINGTAAHAREVDDFGGCGHSGAVVIPAALAAAGLAKLSGMDLILSIVAGYEIAVRVTDALGGYSAHNAQGWHGTGTAGGFGAAAAAGRALGLDDQQLAWALGLAGSYTGGVWAFVIDGAMSKRLHAGKAAETGLVAAVLAKKGFTGPLAIFEDQWGSFLNVYAPELKNPEKLLENLGNDWSGIFKSGFKPYACCRGIHSALDAAFLIKREDGVTAKDVNKITVRASEQTKRQLGKKKIENMLEAQFSLPYSLALAFVVGRAGLEEYEAPYLSNPDLMEFSSRVDVVSDSDVPLGSEPIVDVHLKDGRVISRSVKFAKGHTKNPMSDQELEEKFRLLGQRTLSVQELDRIADLIWRLEEMEDLSDLVQSLIPRKIRLNSAGEEVQRKGSEHTILDLNRGGDWDGY